MLVRTAAASCEYIRASGPSSGLLSSTDKGQTHGSCHGESRAAMTAVQSPLDHACTSRNSSSQSAGMYEKLRHAPSRCGFLTPIWNLVMLVDTLPPSAPMTFFGSFVLPPWLHNRRPPLFRPCLVMPCRFFRLGPWRGFGATLY